MPTIGALLKKDFEDRYPDRMVDDFKGIDPEEHLRGSSCAYALGLLLSVGDWIQCSAQGGRPNQSLIKRHGRSGGCSSNAYTSILNTITVNSHKVHSPVPIAFMELLIHVIGEKVSIIATDRDNKDFLWGLHDMNRYRALRRKFYKEQNKPVDDAPVLEGLTGENVENVVV